MDVINRRHRMAQMAGRASVEFYVGLALKGRAEALAKERGTAGECITEDAFVIRTFRNGVGVFVFQCVVGSFVRAYRLAHGLPFFRPVFQARTGRSRHVQTRRAIRRGQLYRHGAAVGERGRECCAGGNFGI